jgi:hypothetical protein
MLHEKENMKKLLFFLPLFAALAYSQEPVPRTYFGMILHCCGVNGMAPRVREAWPSVPFGSLRLWDSRTLWLQINPSQGVYDWKTLDSWLDHAAEHDEDVLYTFGGIPTWASGHPTDTQTCKSWRTPGSCYPPSDLREDGSGTDQTFKDFVTAIARHAHGRIKYWEAYNEPENLFFWDGTMAQLVRMTQDMRDIVKSVDPGAVVVSPGNGWVDPHPETGKSNWNGVTWITKYLEAGGAKYIDVLATHAYLIGTCPTGSWDLSVIPTRTQALRKIMQKNGIGDLPIWSTEGSWGAVRNKPKTTCVTDPDMQMANVGQYYISMWAAGYKRVYWYAWNDADVGNLSTEDGRPTAAGKAYGEVMNWMVGATLTGCDTSKNQTKCTFTRPDGSQYLALWDNTQTCGNGNCTSSPMKVDANYIDYLDLGGGKTKIQNSTVAVGMKPIWLEAPAGGKRK